MSADNFIAVFPRINSLGRVEGWYIHGGQMPSIEVPSLEREWKESVWNNPNTKIYPTRESALVAAHDRANEETILEYGVIEL